MFDFSETLTMSATGQYLFLKSFTVIKLLSNFGVLALSLLFTMVLVKRYHTLDVEKIEEMVRKEFESG